MISDSLDELSGLELPELLERGDFDLEQLLTIKQIHSKIRRNMKIFVQYCRRQHTITEQMISLGLHCPMHESTNSAMKNLSYIAADILTCEHEALADLYIMPTRKSRNGQGETSPDEEIEEEIETDDFPSPDVKEQEKYKFLVKTLSYLNSSELEENCINYIAKALSILVRKKMSQFLEFFVVWGDLLQKMIRIAHYPSMGHLIAKLITDDQINLSSGALQVKSRIVPALIKKIREEIAEPQIFDLMESIQDVLGGSRNCDQVKYNWLQKASELFVNKENIGFFLKEMKKSLETTDKDNRTFNVFNNSCSFLSLIASRMIADEVVDMYDQKGLNQYTPTLSYEVDELFDSFCPFIIILSKMWDYKVLGVQQFSLVVVRAIDYLNLVAKNINFGNFYLRVNVLVRSTAITALLELIFNIEPRGIILQGLSTLIEKLLERQQNLALAQSVCQSVNPEEIFNCVNKNSEIVKERVAAYLIDTGRKTNSNETGIYLRKILQVVELYFENKSVLVRYPISYNLQKIFPLFNHQSCLRFAQKAIVLEHPTKGLPKVDEFQFLAKFKAELQLKALQNAERSDTKQRQETSNSQSKQQKILFKLDGRLRALKDRVKQKTKDKDQNPASSHPQQEQNPTLQVIKEEPQKVQKEKQVQLREIRCIPKQKDQPSLNFFIRHLMIY